MLFRSCYSVYETVFKDESILVAVLGDPGMMQKRCSFSDLRHAALPRVSTDIAARRLFWLAADPAVAIRINLVQSRCNRSVERSRYAESLSDERER